LLRKKDYIDWINSEIVLPLNQINLNQPECSIFLMNTLSTMHTLNLPSHQFRIRSSGDKEEIFDDIRKKFVVLTPEEWVRQNFIAYLKNVKSYPTSLIAVEMSMKLNKMQKRSDVVVYNKLAEPLLIVECKAPNVKINQDVFDQIARYNMTLKVKYLIVTNGMEHYCCLIDHENMKYQFLEDIPYYGDIM